MPRHQTVFLTAISTIMLLVGAANVRAQQSPTFSAHYIEDSANDNPPAPEPAATNDDAAPDIDGYDSGCATGCANSCSAAYRAISNCNADPYCRLLPQDGFIRARGWIDGGVLGNTSNPASNFNGPYNAVQVDNGQLNQLYLILDRPMASDGSFTIGGRADVLYGSDFFLAQSLGLEVNPNGTNHWNDSQLTGIALPQLYGEVGTNTSSVKVGHFYTVVGYEGVQAPTNFFYSHAYSYMFAGPFTQWGAIANQVIADNWQLQAGVVNGWNTLVGTQNHANFLGNLRYNGQDWWSSLAVITGDELTDPAGLLNVSGGYSNRTRYSWIFDRQFTPRLEYVFHQWLGSQSGGAPGGGTALWYGIDQYAYYKLTDQWRIGTRVEWFRDQSGTRVGLTQSSNPNQAPLPGNYGSWTVGLNWTPEQNILIRPELRWDKYSGGPAKPYDDGLKTYQLLLGLDAIVQF